MESEYINRKTQLTTYLQLHIMSLNEDLVQISKHMDSLDPASKDYAELDIEHTLQRFIVKASIYRTEVDAHPWTTGFAEETVSTRGVNSTQIANYQYLVSSSTKFSRYDGTNVSVYNGISAPASVTVAYVSGATGTATWSYRITAFSKTGETLPSSAVLLNNMSFDRENFTARVNWVQPSTASTDIVGFGIYAGLPGDETLIANVGPTVSSYTDTGTPQSSTFTPTVDTTAGVKAKYIKRFDDRLVLAGIENDPTMLMISGKYPYQDRFNWQNGGGYIKIAPDSGDEITGIEVLGQNSFGGFNTPGILVFMKESVYFVSLSYVDIGNYSILNPQQQIISPTGASSFRSIVNIQNNTFYFGRLGLQTIGAERSYLSQIRTAEVSARIRPYVQNISAPIFANALLNSHFCSSVNPSIASSGLKHPAIALTSAAGDSNVSNAEATSAVITTGLPLASSLTSTGIDGGRSRYSRPAASIAAASTGAPSADTLKTPS